MFYTYLHKRLSDDKVFYVGMGNYKRPQSKDSNAKKLAY
jgi:hypothetical protein